MSRASSRWSGKSKGTPLGYRFFIFVIRTFGIQAAYFVLFFVVPWYVLTSWSSNKALWAYFKRLKVRFPGIKGLGLTASYLAIGRNIIDKVAVQAGMENSFTWVKIRGEHVVKMVGEGKGGLLLSGHVGNWEFASHFLKGHNGKISVVLLSAEDEAIKQVLDSSLAPVNFNMIPLKQDISHVFAMNNALMDGHVLCMHGDRNLPGARVKKHVFLGEEAEFPAGPFALAAAHKVPVCISFVVRTGNRHYTFISTEKIPGGTSSDAIFERYVEELERVVNQYPLQWFNYYDFWKDGTTSERR